jgi:hypothetical protein
MNYKTVGELSRVSDTVEDVLSSRSRVCLTADLLRSLYRKFTSEKPRRSVQLQSGAGIRASMRNIQFVFVYQRQLGNFTVQDQECHSLWRFMDVNSERYIYC